jgi:hypothetical protein
MSAAAVILDSRQLRHSLELIADREAEVVNVARICKCRRILNSKLHIVLAPIEKGYSSSEYEPQACLILVGIATPESNTGSGW